MKKTKHDNAEDKAGQQDVNPADLPEMQEQETKEPSEDIRDVQLKELSDKYMRLAAEYDNFRRRSQKEKEGLYIDSIVLVAAAWLPVIDNLERGIASAAGFDTEEAKRISDGMELILQQAKDALKSLGIAEVDALGKTFDPHTMEALMHAEDENAGENEVALVLSKGYKRGDRVIRHAKVKVVN
ncbi:MAG: nucleotide exchange factor GrpE [Saccharofermentanales bacterium]